MGASGQINVTEERLAELTKIKKDNESVLANISKATEALNKKRGDFDIYLSEETQKLNTLKSQVVREAENHEASAANVAILKEINDSREKLAAELQGHAANLAEINDAIEKAKEELAAVNDAIEKAKE